MGLASLAEDATELDQPGVEVGIRVRLLVVREADHVSSVRVRILGGGLLAVREATARERLATAARSRPVSIAPSIVPFPPAAGEAIEPLTSGSHRRLAYCAAAVRDGIATH
jgi:hypothetical protein